MFRRRMGTIATTAAVVAALSIGGASLAAAATDPATPSVENHASGRAAAGSDSATRGLSGTVVTGDDADAVIAAVAAEDADADITEVRLAPDGSYRAVGTSGDDRVVYQVSADLATVTAATGRGERPEGAGRGGSADGEGRSAATVVTGDDADAVIAAVAAEDADADITEVRLAADGSYRAVGTSGDDRVVYQVSADLATVTAATGRGGRGDGAGRGHGGPGAGAADSADASGTTSGSAG
ncbi:hypothetical protein [Sanguibacter antarcticus]|uniref:YpeB-like protein with protease inhibitory function n=1 Tax=Sanguibacter antarcticus TaxID=372484 RepID=A0A2A9E5A9_9MICO|nr:hypothetical protein [Sanguibacter antarcticus]PFG33836.1 hypothetical protein ATL42_1728 [Sanguibacter antarcticus]